MNPESFTFPIDHPLVASVLRRHWERRELEIVDHEARLSEWDAVLRQKRGCRR